MARAKGLRAGVFAAVGGLACSGAPLSAQFTPPAPSPTVPSVGAFEPGFLPGTPSEAVPPGEFGTSAPAAPPAGGAAAPGGVTPGGSTPGGSQSAPTGNSGGATGAANPDSKKFHGHRYPIQPFAPPGAAPIPPSGPGYYTLLDNLRGQEQEKPPRWPYPRGGPFQFSFFETDFTYLDSVPFGERAWAEKLKRVPIDDHWLFSTGGELRYRFNSETNTRLSGVNDQYNLYRNRTYFDTWYEDVFRFYAEFYYGDTADQDFPPYPRDVNRGDIQNMFADVKLGDIDGNPIYFRAGRQELIYGSQRLVSANDWGNNRNRFDGGKVFYRSSDWDIDAFVTRPTLSLASKLDPSDHNQLFSGLWATYKPRKGTFLDLYYLNLENDNPNVATGQFRKGSFNVSTLGSRYYRRFDNNFLVDVEGMLQTGHFADQSIMAQGFNGSVGYNFKDVWSNPTLWFCYDYASGDPDPNGSGTHRTFNQLFQFGHYYYGFIDITGGQNIRDFNVQYYSYPSNWVTFGAQYHVFRLDSNKDALFNSAGGVLRQDKTGLAGDDIGSELDLITNFHLTDRQDVFLNYSHFYVGQFIKKTGPAGKDVPLDYLYAQYTFRW